jgi:hypothetical protein
VHNPHSGHRHVALKKSRAGHTQARRVEPRHVDTQSLRDSDTGVYEAVATLEYAGHRPSRDAIAAAAGIAPEALDQMLADLTAQGLLTVTGVGADAVYEPASRGWSTQPDQAAGHPMS